MLLVPRPCKINVATVVIVVERFFQLIDVSATEWSNMTKSIPFSNPCISSTISEYDNSCWQKQQRVLLPWYYGCPPQQQGPRRQYFLAYYYYYHGGTLTRAFSLPIIAVAQIWNLSRICCFFSTCRCLLLTSENNSRFASKKKKTSTKRMIVATQRG
jgi:hypothetical protein